MPDPAPDPDEDDSYESQQQVEYEHYLAREEAIEHLESFIKAFRQDESITLNFGEKTVEFEPPDHLKFEFEYEEDGDEREIEFELEWDVQEDELEIRSSE
ncbi:amphi-Trp domain-containing protein [Natrialbaceae archaeon A-CW3]